MNLRARLAPGGLAVLVLAALVLAAPFVAAWAVRRGVREAHAAAAPYRALFVDSLPGDSAAFAALPEPLQRMFEIHRLLATPQDAALPLYECIQLRGRRDDELRRRLQLRLVDSSAAVLFVIADRERGALRRVEFLRRIPRGGQRGFTWDGTLDRTMSVWWFEGPRGLSRREERGVVPRGSPIPRAVRGLGRQLLVAPCADSSANSPMNPISGSRD